MNYIGDYKEDDTVLVMFNTFTSDDPSASCTITNFVNTDVHIHKEDDLTQRNNAAGITVSTNFDGITGSHMIKIDTNDNTVAGFWVAAKDYFVRIEGTTVDGATINAAVAHFSIENRYMRGTESAYTGTPPTVGQIRTEMEGAGTKLTLTLEDTDDLQTNQGAWLTATGFSTHDAAAVKTAIEAAGSKITLILEDTADMQPNQGAWATAVGFSTHDAAAVKTAMEAAGSKLTLVKDKTDTIPADLGDVNTAAQDDAAHGAGNWEGGGAAPTVGQIRTEMEGAGTKLTLTLADTDEMQGNQGNWATAVGFNTTIPDVAGTAAALHATTNGKIDALDDTTVADIIAGITDGGLDLQEMMRIILAFCACKSSGGGTATIKFRDYGDAKDRITATVDVLGNRTAITLDGS